MVDSTKINQLSKVTLSIEAGDSEEEMNFTKSPVSVEFIFGVGQGGISDFEYKLAEKSVGEEVCLHLNNKNFTKTFEHLSNVFLPIMENHHEAHFRIKISDVKKAENREIVNAMASMTPCGCDCGCGH